MRNTTLLIAVALVIASCASPKTESGFTKSELREIKATVAKKTSNEVTGLSRKPDGDVSVMTEAPDRSTDEFILHHSTEGWVVVDTYSMRWAPPIRQ